MADEIVMGVELGPGYCSGCLVSPRGSKGDLLKHHMPIAPSLVNIRETLSAVILELKELGARRGWGVQIVGLSVNGLISNSGEVISSRKFPNLAGQNICNYIHAATGLKAYCVNRYHAIAWAEHLFGAARKMNCCLVAFVGSSVGSGLILDRRIWYGADRAAGKIGHFSVGQKARSCDCGRTGCLEQYLSYRGVRETLVMLRDNGYDGLRGIDLETITVEQIIAAANNADLLAVEALRASGSKLGLALSSIDAILNLDGIVVAGPLSRAMSYIAPTIQAELKANAFTTPRRGLMLLPEEIGEASGCVGAAMRAWENFS